MLRQTERAKRKATQQRRDAENREMSRMKRAAGLTFPVHKIDPDCLAARLAEIPPDTRSLTARICGDPIPGRRAIDFHHAIAAKGEEPK